MQGYFTEPRHDALRQEVREFAEREVRPRIPEMEAGRRVEIDLVRRIAERGWIGVTVDPAYGGMGAGHVARTVIIEEISRVSGAMGAAVQASILGVAKIIHFGSEAQRKTWLPRIASGECLPTIATTEEQSGGHILGMSTTAVRDGDDYVLNGHKVYVGNSHIGDVHGVVARTGTGRKDLSAFLVERDRPGLTLAEHKTAMGLHGFSFGKLLFRNCRVPAENLVGCEGDGLRVAHSSSVLYGRPNLTAVAFGIHKAVVEEAVTLCKERRRYGKPLGELHNIKLKLGEMKHRLMTAELTAYHAAHLLDQGAKCDAELYNAKYFNVEAAVQSARDCLNLHAASGLFTDRPVERYLRDAFHIYPPAGTGEVQLLRLAQLALGTYRGQWSERLADKVSLQAQRN